ncbi:MAG TPA: hypothetical protein DCE41_33020 [Cytophagales bacterium]|nr:hypothetical protein [Cytophagales bacterium]
MANNPLDYMKEVLAAPLGELISSVGSGVADAQAALDAGSLSQWLSLYSEDGDNDEVLARLREIGYQPTFYTLPETSVEAKVSLSLSAKSSLNAQTQILPETGKTRMMASPVNASIANRFNLDAEASATLKFKVVPVPPPGNVSDIRVAPNLVTLTLAEAEAKLSELNLQYQVANQIDGSPADFTQDSPVMAQTPAAGSLVRRDQIMVLQIPDPDAKTVPNLANQTLEDAAAMLTDMGLLWTLKKDENGDMPRPVKTALVTSYTPAFGNVVEDGDTITLEITEVDPLAPTVTLGQPAT